ncbi:hypothetical protein [Glaciecola sp. 1036]|uniref:hypothetical protein n=1 Tax=Alteromonadaceae TaxID=72275 RepID=UPI003D0794F8
MRKLSQKAWNNVLIFSMLILIVIFNWERFFGIATNDRMQLVPTGSVVLSMQIDQVVFERIGTSWRVNAPKQALSPDLDTNAIEDMVKMWQSATIKQPDVEIDKSSLFPLDHVVTLFVSGEGTPLVYSFKTLNEQVYVIYDARYYVLDFPSLEQLVPQP